MNTAQNGDVEIAFETIGEGFPLVMLHGFTLAGASWRTLGYVAPLMAAGRQVVLIDTRGHGASGKPRDPAAYAIHHRTADILAVLDALSIARADVWGYSMGGWITLGLMRDHPHRLRRAVVGGVHPYAESMAFYRDAIAPGLDHWAGLVERLAGAPLDAATRAALLANDREALAAAVAFDRDDMSDAVAAAGVPMLLYAGEADPVLVPLRRFAAAIGAGFVGIESLNHIQTLLHPERILPHVSEFLGAAGGANDLARAGSGRSA